MPFPLHDKPPSAARRIKFLRACPHALKPAVTPGALGQRACGQAQGGAAAVEFALILPILLVLLLGTIEGSLAMYDKAVITNASREGARAGIVARTTPLSEGDIRQVVQAYTQNAVVDFGQPKTLPVVAISQGSLGANPTLIVSVSYTFQGLALGRLLGTLGQPWVMNARTVMAYE
ncbi:MAG: hypothetical protein RLZZ280_1005 [Pseudomonadota bacterium]